MINDLSHDIHSKKNTRLGSKKRLGSQLHLWFFFNKINFKKYWKYNNKELFRINASRNFIDQVVLSGAIYLAV